MAELTTAIDQLLAQLHSHEEAAAAIRVEIRDARKRLVMGRRRPAAPRTTGSKRKRAARGLPIDGAAAHEAIASAALDGETHSTV